MDPTNPNMPAGPMLAAPTQPNDPMREMQMRRLAMAMMQGGPAAPQQPAQNGFAGLAQGINQGQGMARQQDMNQMMGVESPFAKMMKMFGGGGGGAPPVMPNGGMG